MSRNLFLTFEGIDGCGKSTQVAKAAKYLASKGISCVVTREPGGTPIAEKIRELILSPENLEMKNSCELLLYLAARAQHVQEKIKPALAEGNIVLCDRYQEATFAYQGFGRGYELAVLRELNSFATGNIKPTRTFVFDISVECAFERMRKIGKEIDRLENNSTEFFNKIRKGYQTLAAEYPARILLIEGEQGVDDIFNVIRKEIDNLL